MGTAIAEIIAGFAELLFGRKLFWILVGIGGFLIGWFLAPAIWHSLLTWQRVLIGIVLGLGFALLAHWFIRFMVALAGFFSVGTLAVVLVRHLGAHVSSGSVSYFVTFIVGGLVGAVLLGMFFNWALLILTSLVGAGSVAIGIVHFVSHHPHWLEVVLFIILAVLGFAYQARRIVGHNRGLGGAEGGAALDCCVDFG